MHLLNSHRALLVLALSMAAAIAGVSYQGLSPSTTRPADAPVTASVPAGLSLSTVLPTFGMPTGLGAPVTQAPASAEATSAETDRTGSPPAPETALVNTVVPLPTLAPVTGATASAAGIEPKPVQAGREQARSWLVEAGWPDHLLEEALDVMRCESGYSPYARNGVHYGLFQFSDAPNATIRGSWFTYWNVPFEEWSNPVVNARMAWWTYGLSGWGNWQCKP